MILTSLSSVSLLLIKFCAALTGERNFHAYCKEILADTIQRKCPLCVRQWAKLRYNKRHIWISQKFSDICNLAFHTISFNINLSCWQLLISLPNEIWQSLTTSTLSVLRNHNNAVYCNKRNNQRLQITLTPLTVLKTTWEYYTTFWHNIS